MGCGTSRNNLEARHHSLDFKMEEVGETNMDDYFKDCSDKIEKLEQFRKVIVDEFDVLLLVSGVGAFKNPDLGKVYKIIVSYIEVSVPGFVKEVIKISDIPYFKLDDKLNEDIKKVYDQLSKYYTNMIGFRVSRQSIFDDIKKLRDEKKDKEKEFLNSCKDRLLFY